MTVAAAKRFFLWKAVLGRTPKIAIEKREYDHILTSKSVIVQVIAIEEEWENLIQNYLELELEFLKSAMQTMVLNHESYHEFQQTRLIFARRLANFLQSCRSYIDHIPHYLGMVPIPDLVARYKSLAGELYDSSSSYRFMEALRNYAQHRGLPLHGASYDVSWTGDFSENGKNKGLMRHSVAANIDLEKIRADKRFKKSIVTEIDQDLDQLDVVVLIREYVEGLADVHSKLRAVLKEPLDGWKSFFRSAISKYGAANDGDVVGLTAAIFDQEGRVGERTDLFEELPERVEKLQRRNGNLVNLRLRYVTNEITPKRAAKRLTERKPKL